MTSSSNKLTEFHGAVVRMQEKALLCRPNDALSFALTYLEDERSFTSNVEVCAIAHALQSLPYLLKNSREFAKAMSLIYHFILKSSQSLRPNNELIITEEELAEMLSKYRIHEKWEEVKFIDEVL